MKKLVVFNWKCNPPRVSDAKLLLRSIRSVPRSLKVVVCLPFPFLHLRLPSGIERGAQDTFWKEAGPYTGAVSTAILKSMGVAYVIVGHSERRTLFGESDTAVAKKVRAALGTGLKVILCIGEDRPIQRNGVNAVKRFIRGQLRRSLRGVPRKYLSRNLVVAYEPTWAISSGVIGSGRADSPENAAQIIRDIKEHFRTSYRVHSPVILYGGSVTSRNVDNFVQFGGSDGFLVGGASLKPQEVQGILSAASKRRR